MSVSTEERSIRRRLVYNAMPTDLPLDIVQQCIGILENEFGEQPEIKYSQLIKRLNESITTNLDGNKMLGKIMLMRRKSADDIGPDPGPAPGPDPGVAGTNGSRASGAKDVVFNNMFNTIIDQIRSRGSKLEKKFRSELPQQCQQAGLKASCLKALARWAQTAGPSAISADAAELQKIVNQSFVFMCQKLGPVDADKILHLAINKAGQLPESFEFSPKELM